MQRLALISVNHDNDFVSTKLQSFVIKFILVK